MRCFVILAGALAILSTAASGRLLQQDPLAQVALQTAPTSPLPVTVALTTSPDPALPLVAVPINRTAAVPAVLVPVPNAALAGTSAEKTTAAGNATAGPALRIPTFAELVLTANASANLTYLATIVDALGLNETLDTPVTFFAPSNEAWDKAAVVANLTVDELLNLTLSDPEILVAVLSYHIHPGALLASQVVLGANVSTALPRVNLTAARIAREGLIRSVAQPLSSTVDTNLTVLSVVPSITVASAWAPDVSNATVIFPDIRVGASVVHVIDTLLVPPPDALPDSTDFAEAPVAELGGAPFGEEFAPAGEFGGAPAREGCAPAGEFGGAPARERFAPTGQFGGSTASERFAPVGERFAPTAERFAPVGEQFAPAGEFGGAPASERFAAGPAGEFGGSPVGEPFAPAGEVLASLLNTFAGRETVTPTP